MGGPAGRKDRAGGRKSHPDGNTNKRAQRRPPRARRTATSRTRETGQNEGHLQQVVEALCALEEGRPLLTADLPPESVDFFLEHAEHFRTVAFGALRLLKWLALRGDEARRIRVARALERYVEVHSSRVEQLLLLICAGAPSAALRDAVAATLATVLAEAERISSLDTRWSERSDDARDVLLRARERWARDHVGALPSMM